MLRALPRRPAASSAAALRRGGRGAAVGAVGAAGAAGDAGAVASRTMLAMAMQAVTFAMRTSWPVVRSPSIIARPDMVKGLYGTSPGGRWVVGGEGVGVRVWSLR